MSLSYSVGSPGALPGMKLRGWIVFRGGASPVLLAQSGTSGSLGTLAVTRTSVGQYSITYTAPDPDMIGDVRHQSGVGSKTVHATNVVSMTTGGCTLQIYTDGATLTDPVLCYAAFYGP